MTRGGLKKKNDNSTVEVAGKEKRGDGGVKKD